jgi:hypothetical protein
MHIGHWLGCGVILVSGMVSGHARAGVNYEEAPINYSTATPDNPVSRLQSRIATGDLKLDWSEKHGYLPALLQVLDIPVSSQVLVFSKTSLQHDKVGPKKPRAIYFNDEVHVGYVQNGILEIAAADPQLGMVFYTLEQSADAPPAFQRRTNNCLTCHGGARTRNVPGLQVRSVFPDTDGQPIIAAGSFLTNPSSPLSQRWGGWYVTGTHGDQTHLGNFTLAERKKPKQIENAAGQNVRNLSGYCDVTHYLSPHSDIVALMVLEHQTHAYNVLTQAAFEVRYAEHMLSQAVGDGVPAADHELMQSIERAAENLAAALLFAKEARLTSPIQGTSLFASEFAMRGPRNQLGQSLREFDLKTRVFRFPLSYLIRTPSYQNLPKRLRASVERKLRDAIVGSRPIAGQHPLTQDEQTVMLGFLSESQ